MLLSLLRLVLRRSLGHWKLLLVVAAGVVLASALTASTAIYSDAIRDLGLTYALRQVPRQQLDMQIFNSSERAIPSEYNQRRQIVLGTVHSYAGQFFPTSVEYGHSATFFPTAPGEAVSKDEGRPRAFLQYVDDLQDHVRVTDGKLALHTDPPADASQPPTLNVVLGKATADKYDLHVGDRFDMHPFWRETVPPVPIVVGGIVEPRDPNEEYWFGKTDRFSVDDTSWRTYPFFVDRQTIIDTVARYLPDIDLDYTTFFFVKLDAINARNATQLDRNLRAAEQVIKQRIDRTTIDTKLPDTLTTFRQKLFFTRLPLFALIMQVVGIILYYIVMVSTMLVDRQAGEIALLKSRGAGKLQVLIVYAIEGTIIALLGIALGPPLAALIVKVLGPTPPFHALAAGHLLTTRISVQSIELAAAGAGLSLLALLWPAYRASRLSIVVYKQQSARPPRAPVFMRYYLDVVLIVVGAVLFYELRERGSLVTKQLFGDLKADPLLLMTPTLFMLMIALLFLRLFPLLLRLIVRLLGEVSGPSILLGLWHIVRTPVHYTRLILLLILVTGLGVFAAGFRTTLDGSYRDRAAYQAGAEVRLQGIRLQVDASSQQLEDRFKQVTGAKEAVAALRTNGSYSPKRFSQVSADVLAIDPARFANVAFWRDDFSSTSLQSIDRSLEKNEGKDVTGIELPAGARGLGVWVQTPSRAVGYSLAARLQDGQGRVLDYALLSQPPQPGTINNTGGQPVPGDWTFFYAALNRPGFGFNTRPGASPPEPVRFLSIYVRSRPGQSAQPETITDYFEGLQVTSDPNLRTGPSGFADSMPVQGFTDAASLEALAQPPAAQPDSISRAGVLHEGRPALQLTWNRSQADNGTHGFRVQSDGQALIAYADATFLSAAGLKTGSKVTMNIDRVTLPVQIAGSFTYFPAFTPGASADGHLLVVDLARLRSEVVLTPGLGDNAAPDEIWAAGVKDFSDTDLRRAGINADKTLRLSDIQASQQHDPLVAASWEGILFLSFAAILALAALGFTVYSYLTAQARTLEFAVLRTMGLSRPQIATVVGFEQLFVVASGVIAGTLLGLPLSRVMIGYMGITETGEKVVPPMVGSVSWQAAGTAYAGLAIVLVAVVAALVLLYGRLSVSQALRMGEV